MIWLIFDKYRSGGEESRTLTLPNRYSHASCNIFVTYMHTAKSATDVLQVVNITGLLQLVDKL